MSERGPWRKGHWACHDELYASEYLLAEARHYAYRARNAEEWERSQATDKPVLRRFYFPWEDAEFVSEAHPRDPGIHKMHTGGPVGDVGITVAIDQVLSSIARLVQKARTELNYSLDERWLSPVTGLLTDAEVLRTLVAGSGGSGAAEKNRRGGRADAAPTRTDKP